MPRKLHIGGHVRSEGWEVLNVNPAPHVDHVRNATDLSIFENNVFEEIYASHVVEHLDYAGELLATLKEWRRVLKPGGRIYISVPDMDTLAKMFLSRDAFSAQERFFIMRMIFGGHIDKYDYHVVGLNEEFLSSFLLSAGFTNLRRVSEFGFFEDTSSMKFKGTFISLNIIAEKNLNASADKTLFENIGRNAPCPCGSGKKFKYCHGKMP